MAIELTAAHRKFDLRHDENGSVMGVWDPNNGPQWQEIEPVPPTNFPPGQILYDKTLEPIRLITTKENPTCYYVIVGGRAYKICR